MAHGKVYLVGAGPGDPKLLTVKAVELIKQADVIIYDRLGVSDEVLGMAPASADKIFVGKRTGLHEVPQDKITELIIVKAKEGGKIVRLKGGDPFIFGRGGEEAEALVAEGIEFEIVPGISSSISAPMYAGIPLTHRDFAASVAITTGHRAGDAERPVDWVKIAKAVDTMVILMGVESLEGIIGKLLAGGISPNKPVAIVESGTLPQQQTLIATLGTVIKEAEAKQIKPPSVILIGEVATLGRKLAWFKKPPLKGRVVAITRPAGQTEEAGELIRAKGGIPYYIPAIEIKGLSNPEPMKKFIKELTAGTVDYVALMSTNGVKYLFSAADEVHQTKQLHEGLKSACVIAVGPKTAEAMQQYKVRIDIVPEKYSSEGLLEALKSTDLKGKKICIPRTSNATPTLANQLRERGADVEEIYVYESGLPINEELKTKFYTDLIDGHINAILFGSSLSAKNIFKMLSEKAPITTLRQTIAQQVTIIAIGPTTAQALRELGIKVDVIPDDYLFDKALDALGKYWSTNISHSAN